MRPFWKGSLQRAAAGLTIVVLGLLSSAPSAHGAVRLLSLTDLVSKSKYVVKGEVVAMSSYRGPFLDLGEVTFTDVRVRVEGVLKGTWTEAEITVQVLGGQIGTKFQVCPESARYEKGEKVLLFLREYNGAIWNTGWLQGKYSIDAGSSTLKGDPQLPISTDVPLSAMEAEVARLAVLPGPSGATPPPSAAPQGSTSKDGGAK